MSQPANLLNLPAELAQLALQWSVAKYIEGAGSAPGAMTARAATLKGIVTQIDAAVLSNMTLAQLLQLTAAELESKNIPQSTVLLIQGLLSILPPVLPTQGILATAASAIANQILQVIIGVCTQYGA